MKNTLIILIGYYFLFVLQGCSAIEKSIERHQEKKANRFFNEHRDKDAQRCADHFPLKDSTGRTTIDSTRKADNQDYTTIIDSLHSAWQGKQENDSMLIDSINRYWIMAMDSSTYIVSGGQLRRIRDENAGLKKIIERLHTQYKPCASDTVYLTAEHWYIDGAEIEAATLKAQKEYSLRTAAEKKLSDKTSQNKVRLWMLIAAGILILLLLIVIYLIIRAKNKAGKLL